jgi:hypothetical protein
VPAWAAARVSAEGRTDNSDVALDDGITNFAHGGTQCSGQQLTLQLLLTVPLVGAAQILPYQSTERSGACSIAGGSAHCFM